MYFVSYIYFYIKQKSLNLYPSESYHIYPFPPKKIEQNIQKDDAKKLVGTPVFGHFL